MGSEATTYNYIAVKISMQELRAWLISNKKRYKDSSYSNSKSDLLEIVSEWAGVYDNSTKDGKVKPVASFDYESEDISGIYMGIFIGDVGMNARVDCYTESEEISLKLLPKYTSKVSLAYPGKEVKLVSIISVS